MTKTFSLVSKILLILAVILLAASFIIPGISGSTADRTYLQVLLANSSILIFAITGAVLIYSNNGTAKRIGHGITVGSFVLGLSLAVTNLNGQQVIDGLLYNVKSTSGIIMIVASALLLFSYLFRLIILIINKNGADETGSPAEDIRVIRIREWKQILDEGIITEEEFEEKRVSILGLNKSGKAKTKND